MENERGVIMDDSRHQLKNLAVKAYLWGQRSRWPLPRAARRIGRKLFAPRVDQLIPSRTDEWPDLSEANDRTTTDRQSTVPTGNFSNGLKDRNAETPEPRQAASVRPCV